MAIVVKNPALKKKVFREIHKYENLAIRAYNKGQMKKGKVYERKADRIYKKNYNKMFEVR